MPYQPVPNVASFNLNFLAGTERIQNTLYFWKSTDWTEGDLLDVAAAIETSFGADLAPHLPGEVALNEIIGTALESLESPRAIYAVDPAIPGVLGTGAAPLNSTFAIRFGTNKRGRGRQGRVFVPALAEENISEALIGKAYADSLAAGYEAIALAVEGATGAQHCVVHRRQDGVVLPTATNDLVTQYNYTNLILDSQKLRLPGHKRQKRSSNP